MLCDILWMCFMNLGYADKWRKQKLVLLCLITLTATWIHKISLSQVLPPTKDRLNCNSGSKFHRRCNQIMWLWNVLQKPRKNIIEISSMTNVGLLELCPVRTTEWVENKCEFTLRQWSVCSAVLVVSLSISNVLICVSFLKSMFRTVQIMKMNELNEMNDCMEEISTSIVTDRIFYFKNKHT